MHFSRKTSALAAMLGCALATPAFGQTKSGLFSYNYVQLSYVDLDAGFEGLKLDGSFDINPQMALITSYMSTDNGSRLNYDIFTLGMAYHTRLASLPKTDLSLHGEFAHASLDHIHNTVVHSDDDNGLRFGAMLRYQAQPNIELFGDLSYSSVYNNDLALTGGINLALNQQFSAVASIELSDDDMMLLGIRMRLK